MAGIVWLASYPKSGNTWLRAFLANYIANSPVPLTLKEISTWRACMADARVENYERFSGLKREALTPQVLSRLRSQVHLWMAYRNDPESVFVKTHSAMGFEGGRPLITPDATLAAVYVLRNPFDLAVSYMHHFQVDADVAVRHLCNMATYTPDDENILGEYLTSWANHVNSWLAAKDLRLHVMRYEDMQSAPAQTFRQVVAFLGLPQDEGRLQRAISHSSFDELKRQESENGFSEARADAKAAFFRRGKTGGWRDQLTDDQVQKLINSGGEVMRRFGYLDIDGALTV